MSNEKTKHVDGPWRMDTRDSGTLQYPIRQILRDLVFVEGVKPTTYVVAEVHYPSNFPGTVGAEQREVTARLIAAAPELLAALKALTSIREGAPGFRDAFANATAAIARAEGCS